MKMMKKAIALALSMMMVLALTACGSSEEKSESNESGDSAMIAALILDGPIDDGGWNADCYNGLVRLGEELGYEKPDTRFFNIVRETTHYNPETTLVVGDGLTSDIRGANYAGLKCCWYNPGHKHNIEGVHVDYEIDHLLKLIEII